MRSIGWDPVAWPLLVAGIGLIAVWLWIRPPSRGEPLRGALRVSAAGLLLLALFDVGCHRSPGAEGPRLSVLIDASHSMAVADPGGSSRAEQARAFLESDAFERWSEG
ncbi:MAG: hypothetical protein R3326_08845, partial [Gemmatimonadota bacterium]|nr:hypothetical protein [Gemmatimonadota bacterium]